MVKDKVDHLVLFDNKYLTIKFYPECSLFVLDWKPETRHMTLEEFDNMVAGIPSLLKQYRPRRFFNNLANFNFVVDLDKTQKPRQVLNLLENMPEFEKEAYILPVKNLDAHMSIRILLEKIKPQYVYEIFINEDDAMEWLIS